MDPDDHAYDDLDEELACMFAEAAKANQRPRVTPESIAWGEACLVSASVEAARAFQARITSGEVIMESELGKRLGISRQAISSAVVEGRLFSMVGPDDLIYYPTFYADSRYARSDLEQVILVLGEKTGVSKFCFFTSRYYSLSEKTPLEALEAGELESVLTTAAEAVAR